MLAAHTDTVFPMETDVTVRQEGSRYYCPGINDDTHAVAEIMAVAKAMVKHDLHAKGDILFCANVCEEGLGDLKGVKHIFGHENTIDAFVSVDNPVTGGVVYTATGSRRYQVTFTGSGGHSFSDFGLPNPICILSSKNPWFCQKISLVLTREFPGNCQINSLVLPRYFTRMRALRRR